MYLPMCKAKSNRLWWRARPTLEMLDFAFHIGSTPTFLYLDLYLNTAYAAHYI